jgi:hypothetical protein
MNDESHLSKAKFGPGVEEATHSKISTQQPSRGTEEVDVK